MADRHEFSALEGLRIAVEMEKRGGAFYARAARFSRSDAARDMLLKLAAEEQIHEREFSRLYQQEESRGEPSARYDEETSAYLSAIAADIVFAGGLMAIRDAFDDPVQVVRQAIASEKDSILFYTELAGLTDDPAAARIFRDIARQERGHLMLLEARLAELC